MVVNANSGEINSTTRLRVRGTSTLIGNREPLWVLDGIPLDGTDIPSTSELKDIDNLYMAGRCISGDFLSQASYRVTGPAVEMGEGVVRRVFG